MAVTIQKAFVQQFESNVLYLAKQMEGRLRNTVRNVSVTGEKHNFERLGHVEAVEKTTRHTNTPILEVPHSRRVVTMRDWQWGDLIDDEDTLRMLVDPKSSYVQIGAGAMNRKWDSLIIDAALGTSTDGDAASVTFPAGNTIAHGSAGLTIAKLLEAKKMLDSKEVPDNDRCIIVTAKQMEDLLGTTQVTSSDFNTVKALVSGSFNSFMGFTFIRSEQLAVASSVRSVIAYQKDAIGLAVGRDVETKIAERADKSFAHHVYLRFSAACTRIDEDRVVEIECSE
jgi:hypothetical protein|tara:strand:+ start:1526 stop:2374 length:849 start_codon:yes stop_codon:yes gene_type:complete